MPPPMPVNMPKRADATGLNPNSTAFCVPATAKNDSPAASNSSTGVRSLLTPAYQKKVMSPARTQTSRYRPSVRAAGGTAPISTSRVIPPISRHEGQDEDPENVESAIDRGDCPADREN